MVFVEYQEINAAVKKDKFMSISSIFDVSNERHKLLERLLKALDHLPRERQFAILTSWYSVKKLRKITKFQERD